MYFFVNLCLIKINNYFDILKQKQIRLQNESTNGFAIKNVLLIIV